MAESEATKSSNVLDEETLIVVKEVIAQLTELGFVEIDPVLIVQYCIVGKNNVEKIITKYKNLQKAIEELKIKDVPEEDILAFCSNDGSFISGFGQTEEGTPFMIFDLHQYTPADFGAKEVNALMAMLLLMFDTMADTIENMSKHGIFITDCADMGWKHFDASIEKKASKLYQSAYPIFFGDNYLVDSPFLMRAILQICRLFIQKKLMDRIHCIKTGTHKEFLDSFKNRTILANPQSDEEKARCGTLLKEEGIDYEPSAGSPLWQFFQHRLKTREKTRQDIIQMLSEHSKQSEASAI